MKRFLTVCAALAPLLFFSQTDVEERDDNFLTENNRTFNVMEVKMPFYQYAVNCTDFSPAAFPGGVEVYKNSFSAAMRPYLQSEDYTLKGPFSFTFDVNPDGEVSNIKGRPEVNGSNVFFSDVRTAMRSIKTRWTAAKCGDNAVKSTIKFKVEFSPDAVDF